MKTIRLFLTTLMVVSLFLSLLGAPLSGTNVVKAQGSDRSPQGWDLEITLPPALAARMDSGELDLLANLQADGLQATREGDRLIVSGQGGADELRRVVYEGIDSNFSLISARTDLSISMPAVKGQILTLKLETNITTGYGWELTGTEGVTFKQQGEAQSEARGGGYLNGAPQLITYIYKAAGKGTGQLNLSYKAPFNAEEAVTTRVNLRLAENPGEIDLSDPSPYIPVQFVDETGPANEPVSEQPLDGALPASFDWRSTAGIVPPIRSQGACGSCWAFSSTGAFESAVKIGGSPLTDLSEQFLVSCNNDGYNCSGGRGDYAMDYFVYGIGKYQIQSGAVTETDMPYTATNGTCKVINSHPYRGYSYGYVAGNATTLPTTDQIKNAIKTYGPITASVCASTKFKAYTSTSGVFSTDESSKCSGTGVNHEVVLVGWNNADSTWILRNSWNTNWGESGYMRIKWGTSRIGLQSTFVRYAAPPLTSAPSGNIIISNPAYKWTAVSGATKYELKVYKGGSSVSAGHQFYTTTACSGTSCSANTTPNLPDGPYAWEIRAQVDGIYTGYSVRRNFNLNTAFNSTFTSSTTNWGVIYGSWSRVTTSSNGYYKTLGTAGYFVSTAYASTPTKLDYTVRMKRAGCTTCSNTLLIRGTTTPLSSNKHWNKSYEFFYTNSGYYAIAKVNGATNTALKGWTASSYILKGNWNKLRVVASGWSLKFYINDHLVWSGTDSSYIGGRVGIGMYRDATSTGNDLYVDYATLITAFTGAALDQMEPVEESGEEYPEWTDINTSPH